MRTFYISVRKDGSVFHNLEKIYFELNTSNNIVSQAEFKVASLLDSLGIPANGRESISWKVFSHDGFEYKSVTCSENWLG